MTDTITHIGKSSPLFPPLLKEIPAAPEELFIRGAADLLSHKDCIAVVGTRMMTSYGKQVLEQIIPGLVRAGAVIVSGLAFGIDAYSHEVALRNGGKCIAVFGCGVDMIYPKSNQMLAEKILQNGGALISEYPSGTSARKEHFPARNRIISGLSRATIVVEAKEKSGSLITARFALQQNRDLFAIPGNIFQAHQQGTNTLIAQGASPIISSEDLLRQLGFESKAHSYTMGNPDQQTIFDVLQEPRSLDQIVEITKFSAPKAAGLISMLELEGAVLNVGGVFIKKS